MRLRAAIKIYLNQKQPDILWIHKKYLYNRALVRINKCKNKNIINNRQLKKELKSVMKNKNLSILTKSLIKSSYEYKFKQNK